ncbi:hypothetical protein [Achromobacter phage Motura]|uniref:Uncharacterized protein n=1 Tax=Achromobacter phage Motura TaxID=2591403 RepID=A0A514CSG8_9CAUD|nr:hypothetical protein H1O15_gp006 [Achromobacter phage Motura]QDH83415.1 hypothetical protein [Achromobacter phage Motura]
MSDPIVIWKAGESVFTQGMILDHDVVMPRDKFEAIESQYTVIEDGDNFWKWPVRDFLGMLSLAAKCRLTGLTDDEAVAVFMQFPDSLHKRFVWFHTPSRKYEANKHLLKCQAEIDAYSVPA